MPFSGDYKQAKTKGNLLQWFLLFSIILLSCGIRVRLASMPLERDEGEYAYMAQLILHGIPPYKEAYGMKFPGIYLSYAGIFSILGSTETAIRYGLILLNLSSSYLIYLLGKKLTSTRIGLWSAMTFLATSLSPSVLGITANAEHFVILPVLLGFYLLIASENFKYRDLAILLSGSCFGLAVSIKQQGIVFVMAGFLWLVYMINRADNPAKLSTIISLFIMMVGFFFPLFLMCGWLKWNGVFHLFRFWTIDYAKFYGQMWSWLDGLHHFTHAFLPILKNHFLIFGSAFCGLFLSFKSKQSFFVFSIILSLAGILSTYPGFIFRPHYFIFILPGIALACGYGLNKLGRWSLAGIIPLILPLYLQNQILFRDNPKDAARHLYPNNAFCETREVGRWLNQTTTPNERIAILGSEPEIYFYSDRLSAIPYLYLYPLMEPQPYAVVMQKDLINRLTQSPPPYLVHVRIPTSWLAYPNSEMEIIQWLGPFLESRYQKEKVFKPFGEMDPREIVIYHLN